MPAIPHHHFVGATIPWYSIYGTGALIYGIEHDLEGRVEFTVWFCVLWVPLIPISSWSARFGGALGPDGLHDERLVFADLVKIPHHWPRLLGTFVSGICCLALGVGPTAYMIMRTDGRAATTFEMVLMLALIFWCVGLILFVEHSRTKKLQQP